MCGVVGFWNRDGKIASEVILERMIDKINHRGPDDHGTWAKGSIGLGHCRLSILDLSSRGHQPFMTEDGLGVISYNGEVYNFKDLRKNLEAEGVKFKSGTDTEVVLYALHRWGPEQAVKLFNGMFAFAYYDLRNETLWLGRDKLGIKVLHITEVGGMIAFASEMKALFAHPDVPRRPDLHALTTQIFYQRLDGDWTAFEGIDQVLPGTLLKIAKNLKEEIVYFDVVRDLDVDRIKRQSDASFEDLLLEFEKRFAMSVDLHLISDAPVAAMTSGGVDSSLITARVKEVKPDIVGYVADVQGTDISEIKRARKVCDHLGVELRPVKVDIEEYLRLWPLAIYHNDQPNFYSQNAAFLAVVQAAQRDGFKVALTGEGSDELFGGYNWHAETYRMWRLRRLHSKFVPNILPFRILGRFLSKAIPLNLKELGQRPFSHIHKWTTNSDRIRELASIDAGQRATRERELFEKLDGIKPIEERAYLARSLDDFYCHLRNLLISNDKMGMAYSIEARVPFLENGLIDFAIHLPFKAKYFKGITKRIVKKAAEKRLPHEIVYAKKVGFGVSAHVWQHTKEILKGGMLSQLMKWNRGQEGMILNQIYSDHLMPYHFVCMELWARMYFRGESPEQLGEELLALDARQNGGSDRQKNALKDEVAES